MKVVLLKDIKGTGKAGQVVEVSSGYATNYLFPNKLAKAGTTGALQEAKNANDSKNYHAEQERLRAVESGNKLKDFVCNVEVKCGANGKIFGSVTRKEVASDIEKRLGLIVDKKKIELPNIKDLGTYVAKVKLHPTVVVKVMVNVLGMK